jgi:nitrogen-specific signal transduction histidine kinase
MTPEATAQLSDNQVLTHEFVNSLASVRSIAELLVEYPGLNAGDRCRFITIIRAETERLVRLMNRLNLGSETVASL